MIARTHMAVHLEETKPVAAVTAGVHTPSVNHVQKPHVNATRPVCAIGKQPMSLTMQATEDMDRKAEGQQATANMYHIAGTAIADVEAPQMRLYPAHLPFFKIYTLC